MKRGYVRATRRLPKDLQIAALVAYGVDRDVIYVEGENKETLDEAVRSLRVEAADELVVYTLDRIAGSKRELRKALAAIRDKKAVIVEVLTGRRSDDPDHMAEMIIDALTRKGHATADASRFGAMASHRQKPLRMSEEVAKAIWIDARIRTNAEAAKKIGLSAQQCYNRWGYSGRKAGRPRQRK